MVWQMNILNLVTWYDDYKKYNKAGIFHKELAILLKNNGINVSICYPFDNIDKNNINKFDEEGVIVYRYKNINVGNFFNKTYKFIKFLFDFRYVIKDFKPDVIHAHVGRVAGFYAYLLSIIYKIPYMVSEHAPVDQLGLNRFLVSIKNRIVYKNSKFNTCCSDYNYGLLSNKFRDINFMVLYNPVVIDYKVLDASKKYFVDGYVNCCIVGSFYNKLIKGYQYLLPAIKELKNNGYKIIVHIIGDGEYFNYYKNLANELDVLDICMFYGNCSRAKTFNIMNQMNFCLSVSLHESAGIFCEESMTLGKPLLVTKSGGANSLCNERAAYIIDKGSSEQIYDGLIYMINNFENFDYEYIKQYANEKFGSNAIIKKYIDIYNSIMNSLGE